MHIDVNIRMLSNETELRCCHVCVLLREIFYNHMQMLIQAQLRNIDGILSLQLKCGPTTDEINVETIGGFAILRCFWNTLPQAI